MSGHNKWSKVKHKKAIEDAKKSKEFSKYAQLITIESKKAGGDVNAPGLRKAIERARAANMPQKNIERATKRGLEKDAALLSEVTYEVYGPGGSALIISALTDNKNRTTALVKHILKKYGASLAGPGAVSWAFEKKNGEWIPKTIIPLSKKDKKGLHALEEELRGNKDIQAIFSNSENININ